MILIAIIVVVGAIFVVMLVKKRESFITLDEVIPQARILSQEEGIIEYGGVRYLLGTHDLVRRRDLIERLDLLDHEGPVTIDMRFDTQVIIKQGAGFAAQESAPHSAQSRRK